MPAAATWMKKATCVNTVNIKKSHAMQLGEKDKCSRVPYLKSRATGQVKPGTTFNPSRVSVILSIAVGVPPTGCQARNNHIMVVASEGHPDQSPFCQFVVPAVFPGEADKLLCCHERTRLYSNHVIGHQDTSFACEEATLASTLVYQHGDDLAMV